ncbi:hypothetical protein SADUNF_Sadunf09G0104100 [Salix dunnii]|uniref:Uncharacterized protein n=1 Tax=Salix dunnii TaxID=1413687 RepID=A0A835JY95_9ROSI|nr:hypothetical protein SADUNF_Sadunf09G0104100 [Salix dunnii]
MMAIRLPRILQVKQNILRGSSAAKDVRKGYIAVYVGEEEKKRFVIPVSYLNQPSFQKLLSKAEEEFGFQHPMGGLTIPCFFSRLDYSDLDSLSYIEDGEELRLDLFYISPGKGDIKGVNDTFISLIPKTASPESISQFCLVGLCNFTYKLVAKILVKRIEPLLLRPINSCQSIFVTDLLDTDHI